jgi:GNAT superfamily N-acetyltransferase
VNLPAPARLLDAMEATWPAARRWQEGPWTLREGCGGGKRVSAATAAGPGAEDAIDAAETAMRALGQTPLFMLTPDETTLDAALAARGYEVVDPVMLYAGPVTLLTGEPVKRMTAFAIWPPLAIMRDLWAAAGIGPARIEVMRRATGPATGILARHSDQPAGVAFAACDGDIVMVHAIETVPELRRQGVGRNMLRLAAHWGAAQGALHLALAVTRANTAANALYASIGLTAVGEYHYRKKQDG